MRGWAVGGHRVARIDDGGRMSDAALPGPPHLTEDEKALHKLGYAQELMRAMGVFRNFAISFTIISILAGCLTSYYLAFQWGGPVAVTWGWIDRRRLHHVRRALDGRDRLDLPDRRRPLLLVVQARQPGLGLVHGLVQPDRPDRDHRRRRLRPRDLRDGVLQPDLGATRTTSTTSSISSPRSSPSRCVVNVFDVRITSLLNAISAYWHVIGVADHRRRLHLRARPSPVGELRVHADDQQLGLLGPHVGRLAVLRSSS